MQFALGQGYSKFGLQVRTDTTAAHKVELQGSISGGSSDFQTIVGSTWVIGTQSQGDIVWVNSTGVPTVNYIRATVAAVAKSSSDPGIDAWISAGV
jgi:hypothetical protein